MLKRIIFITLLLLNLLLTVGYAYNCTYDWQIQPHWLCDVNNQYYETYQECNAYCYIAEDGGNTGNEQMTNEDIAYMSALAGVMSASIIAFLWSNMM